MIGEFWGKLEEYERMLLKKENSKQNKIIADKNYSVISIELE